jgi:SagB-type dehydrogenase family enzyme
MRTISRRNFMKMTGCSIVTALFTANCAKARLAPASETPTGEVISLPPPKTDGQTSLEYVLGKRRSMRALRETALSLEEISQLLWATQGITDPSGKRTSPSAGALYPLEVYAASADGFYQYRPASHSLVVISNQDLRSAIHGAALQQQVLLDAPMVFVISAVFKRTEVKYGAERTPRYVYLEAGHAAQNLILQAVALGLGGVTIGAFYDDKVQAALNLPDEHAPIYLIPIGHPR